MDDLEAKIFGRFDDETVVHPGHGDDTTLGVERPHLDAWLAAGLVTAPEAPCHLPGPARIGTWCDVPVWAC
jgi:hypothetical protein